MDDTIPHQEKCICIVRCRRQSCVYTFTALEVHVLRCIKRSVFSEAFLERASQAKHRLSCGCARNYCHVLRRIKVGAFWDIAAINPSCLIRSSRSVFREALGRSTVSFCCVDSGTNRFSLKRRFQWLSYRILVKFDLFCWKSGCRPGFRAAGRLSNPIFDRDD